jgi:hypothetical protein
MKNYDGILILEPEDIYLTFDGDRSFRQIKGGNKPLYDARMAIAKTYEGKLVCMKSKNLDPSTYTQEQLRNTVNKCENIFDVNLLLML